MSQRDYFEKDYYATLGVSKDIPQAELAKVYRKLARELHPDANPGDKAAEDRFKEVSEAYTVLSSPEKRAEYDEVRRMGMRGAPGGFSGYTSTGQGFDFDLGDLFGGMFNQGARSGSARARPGPGAAGRRGRDVETELTLSFADALHGVTTTLRLSGAAPCKTCGGNGAQPGTVPVPCPTCGGNGVIAQDQGLFSFSEPCPTCRGTGRHVATPCSSCRGSGAETRAREIKARIPPGVKDGAVIRLKGKGEAGFGGAPAGDLLVKVHVQSHELFGRRGDDLTLRVPITVSEAMLGTKVTVPTPNGTVTLRIPAGTESGKTLRVRGKGVAREQKTGDLLVTVEIAVPRKLTREQKKLMEQLAATEDAAGVRQHLAEGAAL